MSSISDDGVCGSAAMDTEKGHKEETLRHGSSQYRLPLDRYNLLVEFAHKHLDFQRAELESVLGMHGIVLGEEDCTVLPLPSDRPGGQGANEWFTGEVGHEIMKPKSEKLNGLASADKRDAQEREKGGETEGQTQFACEGHRRPFIILSFAKKLVGTKFLIDNDDDSPPIFAKNRVGHIAGVSRLATGKAKMDIASILLRCTLVRSVVELWGLGETIESCSSSVRSFKEDTDGKKLVDRQSQPSTSWKITVQTLGSKYSREEQNAMRSCFAFLNFPGEVKLDNPDNECILIREIELDAKGSPVYPRHGLGKVLIPENDARPPLGVYFGRVLGGTRSVKGRGGVDQYSLKKRKYLGPTSMDAELSLIMTNLGQVKSASFCFDPFVGTGSILLTCALRGAYCFGTDIDIRVLRGRGVDENVFSNFDQFGLPRPELVRTDNAIYHRHYRCDIPLYDCIVCDPPYGIRAGARKSGSKLDEPRPVLEEHRHDHIAQTRPYPVSDVMSDLLDVASRSLVRGGRLVYIIPSMTDFDVNTDLPRHECLRLIHVCYQPLSMELGRRMVTMEKVLDYNESRRDTYLSGVWVNGAESAEKCANIRERLIEAAKMKPGYEEKAAIRKQKRKANKEAKKKAKLEVVDRNSKESLGSS